MKSRVLTYTVGLGIVSDSQALDLIIQYQFVWIYIRYSACQVHVNLFWENNVSCQDIHHK